MLLDRKYFSARVPCAGSAERQSSTARGSGSGSAGGRTLGRLVDGGLRRARPLWRPRRRSSSRMWAGSHPAWQCTSRSPVDEPVIEQDGFLSPRPFPWPGQGQEHRNPPPPIGFPPSALAISTALIASPQRIGCDQREHRPLPALCASACGAPTGRRRQSSAIQPSLSVGRRPDFGVELAGHGDGLALFEARFPRAPIRWRQRRAEGQERSSRRGPAC
jgi:hypothetical protein